MPEDTKLSEEYFFNKLKDVISEMPTKDKQALFIGFVAPFLFNGLKPAPSSREQAALIKFMVDTFNGEPWRECIRALAEEIAAC